MGEEKKEEPDLPKEKSSFGLIFKLLHFSVNLRRSSSNRVLVSFASTPNLACSKFEKQKVNVRYGRCATGGNLISRCTRILFFFTSFSKKIKILTLQNFKTNK